MRPKMNLTKRLQLATQTLFCDSSSLLGLPGFRGRYRGTAGSDGDR